MPLIPIEFAIKAVLIAVGTAGVLRAYCLAHDPFSTLTYFAGTSSGANVVAAIRAAERLGPDAKIVTMMVDSGLKYLSTDLYRKYSLQQ